MAIKLEPLRPRGSLPDVHRLAWPAGRTRRTAILLACGVVAPVWWVTLDVVGSLRYPGYSYGDQTISELSAEGAPIRIFMLVLSSIPYAVLMTAFGVDIWRTAEEKRAQRITAALVVGETVWGFVGGIAFPMAIRGHYETPRNQMHAWYGIGMPIFFLLAVAFGSRLFGTRCRFFSYGIILGLLVFGALTAMQVPKVAAHEPTPWIGIEERINAYLPMVWFVVLAIGLLRTEASKSARHLGRAGATADGADAQTVRWPAGESAGHTHTVPLLRRKERVATLLRPPSLISHP